MNADFSPGYPRSLKFVSPIAGALNDQLVSVKRLEDAPMERNSNQTKDARRDYPNWMMAGVRHNLIYLGEAVFNLFTRRTCGRALIGQRAVRQVGGSKGQHLTLITAISPGGGLVYFDLMFTLSTLLYCLTIFWAIWAMLSEKN